MPEIKLLSNDTIDKIAAGEVVEKPLNVVKELVENSIDAGSTNISVEIKNGGIELIRVTDNGCGISFSQCKEAFLRHATSKLRTIEDLNSLESLGFRGEALSSISAVSKTEMITKQKEDLLGAHCAVEGGILTDHSEIGAPNGTTIIIRQLFYNTPARRKFLKTPTYEGAAIEDLMEKFALSHPEIAFQFINNGKTKISTGGNSQAKDVAYHIFGKDVYRALLPVDYESEGIKVTGFTAKPEFNYPARNGELYFINGRFVKSKVVQVAIEEVYRKYLMQHQFPFCILYINVSPDSVDVNVHPQKMEVRFSNNTLITKVIIDALKDAFTEKDLIPSVSVPEAKVVYDNDNTINKVSKEVTDISKKENDFVKEPFELYKTNNYAEINKRNLSLDNQKVGISDNKKVDISDNKKDVFFNDRLVISNESDKTVIEPRASIRIPEPFEEKRLEKIDFESAPKFEQKTLFEEKLISDEPIKKYKVLAQVFDTYWLITLGDDLYIVDQHAAHEKVNYERFVKEYESEEASPSQLMNPPEIIHLSAKEEDCLLKYIDLFTKLGFEFENFGQSSYALRSVPLNVYGTTTQILFHELLNELLDKDGLYSPTIVLEKLASMSCKAAIKGGQRISIVEMEHLMEELMKLENPYNCPHGRPVFIKITKNELEKKFKRIV